MDWQSNMVTMGHVQHQIECRRHGLRRKETISNGTRSLLSASRPVRWTQQNNYTLIRNGIPMTWATIEELFAQEKLCESMMYHFMHSDPDVTRQDLLQPKYVGVLWCGNTFFRPQQPYLHQMYKNCNRRNIHCSEKLMPDGTPYWIDLYVNCMRRDRASKQKYSKKKRQKVSVL
jgi:hypothetical protein